MDDMTSDPFAALSQRDHPLRASLSREMHIRGLPRFDAPALALQFVLLVDEQQAEKGIALLSDRFPALKPGDRFLAARIGDLHFSWERHTEFMTYSFLAAVEGATLFDLSPFGDVPAWMADMPGRVIRSTQIAMVMNELPPAAIAAHFATDDLIISDVADGQARIWSDFRLHADGFGRLLIHDKGLQGGESSQLVQRLQELGNYRKIALLGLPEAQQATPLLTALEQRLTAITSRVAQKDADADQVLEQLSALSAELAGIVARTRYRMSATQAYAEICRDRIRRLAVAPVRGYRSLDDFTERRLLPAMRTCDAFTRRLEDLAQRTAWTSALLRTRVDTALARRNRDLLASMDRRTALQLRLQHTVEGLSVVAISYYALGLWHHLKEALELQGWHLPAWIDVALFPVTIVTVFLGIGQIRKVKRPYGSGH
ncbi:hypothetical protein M527_25445 [Sphingobium indicum IP26]|uniref:Egg lysin n=1 Tax=Sphingobium indicum F2 TaxID=1450518 RepID=A0A8E0WV65_9SPHN|nr:MULTISPECIES: DUF3422 domain-containing protein [Sphingobium]EPR15275.1 hypothetical protein M527_25530 [Sphingobium indicum IP26]EPR15291.1 hypothetical protein M527_25445 [Sphingobium indicum IP26]EQB02995.1 hypothetical protein L286_13325 [Sphingobium sp. HDIP04]KER37906.1 hypothetical protein AL00_02630 [Sphingobium indicum F2]